MERTIYLLVAYDGTKFHGWQTQPGLRTVQEVIEQALRRVVRHQVQLVGSGRTDSGVHAAGHVSSFKTTCDIPPDRLRHAIGARLPKDISIVALRDVHPEFNARRSAISKLYRYRMHAARNRPVENRAQRYTYHFWERLDLQAVRAGSKYLIGEHDFTSMTPSKTVRESMVRQVLRCDVERHLDEVRIDVEGTGFLWRQVRTMVGTLLEIGRGRWSPEHVAKIIESRDRANAGPTMPARGLCLQWVRYPAPLLVPPDRECASAEPSGTPCEQSPE